MSAQLRSTPGPRTGQPRQGRARRYATIAVTVLSAVLAIIVATANPTAANDAQPGTQANMVLAPTAYALTAAAAGPDTQSMDTSATITSGSGTTTEVNIASSDNTTLVSVQTGDDRMRVAIHWDGGSFTLLDKSDDGTTKVFDNWLNDSLQVHTNSTSRFPNLNATAGDDTSSISAQTGDDAFMVFINWIDCTVHVVMRSDEGGANVNANWLNDATSVSAS